VGQIWKSCTAAEQDLHPCAFSLLTPDNKGPPDDLQQVLDDEITQAIAFASVHIGGRNDKVVGHDIVDLLLRHAHPRVLDNKGDPFRGGFAADYNMSLGCEVDPIEHKIVQYDLYGFDELV